LEVIVIEGLLLYAAFSCELSSSLDFQFLANPPLILTVLEFIVVPGTWYWYAHEQHGHAAYSLYMH